MSQPRFSLGSWVQARGVVDDAGIEAARERDIGHVIEPPDEEGWVNIFFERTQRVCICHPDELVYLGNASTGKHATPQPTPAPFGLKVPHGN